MWSGALKAQRAQANSTPPGYSQQAPEPASVTSSETRPASADKTFDASSIIVLPESQDGEPQSSDRLAAREETGGSSKQAGLTGAKANSNRTAGDTGSQGNHKGTQTDGPKPELFDALPALSARYALVKHDNLHEQRCLSHPVFLTLTASSITQAASGIFQALPATLKQPSLQLHCVAARNKWQGCSATIIVTRRVASTLWCTIMG